jgi:hypothetical protein
MNSILYTTKKALFMSLVFLGAYYAFASESEQSDEKMVEIQEIMAALEQQESTQETAVVLEKPELDNAPETIQEATQPDVAEINMVETADEHPEALAADHDNQELSEDVA